MTLLADLLLLRRRWVASRFFLVENHRGEIRANRIRLFALFVFYVNECVNFHRLKLVTAEFHVTVSLITLLWVLYAAGLWYLTVRRGWFRPIVQYCSTTLDMILLALVLMVGGRDTSQVFVAYYLLIALGGVRFSFGATLYGGVLAAFSYAVAAAYNDLAAVGHVVLLEMVIRVLAMVVLSVIIAHVVQNSVSILLRVVDEEVKSERIRDTLARYVSAQVADEILKSGDPFDLKGERRVVTILMSDLRGFTSLSERIPAEEVVRFLNDYFSRMIDIIFKYRGTLDKFIGDAILAVFGAPVAEPDHAALAVRAAIEMQEAMAGLNRERRAAGLDEVRMGIGINSGEVIAGNIGSTRRMEYTVIGDPVNLASRIEGRSSDGEILLSEETYEAVKGFVEAEALPEVAIKGKARPVRIRRVVLGCQTATLQR